jgi:6-phosphogluconolactonase
MFELEAFGDREALYDAAADALTGAVRNALAEKGRATIALAGGSTPAPVYRRMAKADLAWSEVKVLATDERQVSPDHPDSNARMLRETLLQERASAATLVSLQTALVERLRPFDAVLLGMGEDGHFASLFPGSPVLTRGLDVMGDAFVLDVPAGDPAPPQARFSLTLRALSGAATCLLLVTGEAKKQTLEAAHERQLPVAALIAALQPRILWAP